MMSHHSHLPPDVLCRLFKSYCCSFYRSFLLQYNSKGFEKICITWNRAVRRMNSLRYHNSYSQMDIRPIDKSTSYKISIVCQRY